MRRDQNYKWGEGPMTPVNRAKQHRKGEYIAHREAQAARLVVAARTAGKKITNPLKLREHEKEVERLAQNVRILHAMADNHLRKAAGE